MWQGNIKAAKLKQSEQVELLAFLANCLKNGFSLTKSLQLLPLLWPQRKKQLARLDEKMRQGEELSQLLAGLGFNKTTVTQLDMALSQGRLDESLAQLALLGRMKNEQVKKLEGELAYPIVLAGMMTLILIFMQNFLSVEFAGSSAKQGDLLLLILVFLLVLVIMLVVIAAAYMKKQDYQSFKKLLAWPVFGPVVALYGQYLISYDLTWACFWPAAFPCSRCVTLPAGRRRGHCKKKWAGGQETRSYGARKWKRLSRRSHF